MLVEAMAGAPMFQSILVPLDGSRFAEAALPWASRLARSAHGGIQLVMVQPTASHEALVPAVELDAPWRDDPRGDTSRRRSYLAETVQRISDRTPACGFALRAGPPAETLRQAIDELSPELVVMSTHGSGSLSPFWLGSVADYLLRVVETPLLLVRPALESAAGPCPLVRRIVVATDLSPCAGQILGVVRQLACLEQAHVTLLHVVEPAPLAPPVPGVTWRMGANLENDIGRAQVELDRLANELRQHGIRSAARVETATDIPGAILRYLREAADLVALTTHGSGGPREMLIGSVADKVIRGASKPVLVQRPSIV